MKKVAGFFPRRLGVTLTIVLIAGFLGAVSPEAFADTLGFDAWGSVQFPGQQAGSITFLSSSASSTTAVKTGASVGADLFLKLGVSELGIGAQEQFSRSLTSGSFSLTDVFLSLRVPIEIGPIAIYPLGRIGYGFCFADSAYVGTYVSLTGGLYNEVGAGVRSPAFEYNLLGLEFRGYGSLEGTYASTDLYSVFSLVFDQRVTYSTRSICVGFAASKELMQKKSSPCSLLAHSFWHALKCSSPGSCIPQTAQRARRTADRGPVCNS